MKNNFIDTEEGRIKIDDFLTSFKEFSFKNEEEIDLDVIRQKTRLQKFWCWLTYGHLLDDNNKCKRCGKQIK
jgi:hypothetical protein